MTTCVHTDQAEEPVVLTLTVTLVVKRQGRSPWVSSGTPCWRPRSVHSASRRLQQQRQHSQYYRFTAVILVNPCQSAHPVENWRILSEQSFTPHVPLPMATSAFGLGRRRQRNPWWCYLYHLCTVRHHNQYNGCTYSKVMPDVALI